jgi:hypothetical protein
VIFVTITNEKVFLFAFFASILTVGCLAQNSCNGFGVDDPMPSTFVEWQYGIQDSADGASVSSYLKLRFWILNPVF